MSSSIAAIVLAAGASSRMPGRNKLLCEVGGVALIERAVAAAAASRCTQVLVVTGWQAGQVEAAVRAMPPRRAVTFVRNPRYASGLGSSLGCAVAALPATTDGALVQLGDMPWVAADHIDRLIEVFERDGPAIVAPVRNGRRGHPVLWPRSRFAALRDLDGDVGARGLLERFASEVRAVPFDTDAIFEDVDTAEELVRARQA